MYVMKAYRVAEARARFGNLLDEAESGDAVVIERNGVRFRLEAERPASTRVKTSALIDYVHPDVASGTWASGPRGLRFRARRPRS